MRLLGLLVGAGVALLACSSSSRGGASADGGDAGPAVECQSGMLVLGGTSPRVPHGSYALSNVQAGASAFAATLPAGGSIELAWSGDATSGPVSVTGTMTLPTEDAALAPTWCVYPPSTLRIAGDTGRLDLTLQPAVGALCGGPSGAGGEEAVACFAPAS